LKFLIQLIRFFALAGRSSMTVRRAILLFILNLHALSWQHEGWKF